MLPVCALKRDFNVQIFVVLYTILLVRNSPRRCSLRQKIAKIFMPISTIAQVTSVIIAMILLLAMTGITSVNVFMRYVMNSGIQWGEELARVLVVSFTFLAMALGVKQGLHINIHVLPQKLPKFLDLILDFFRHIVVIAAGVILVRYGIGLIQFSSRSILPASGFPGSVLYFVMPFSGGLIILEGVLDLFGFHSDVVSFDRFFLKGEEDA